MPDEQEAVRAALRRWFADTMATKFPTLPREKWPRLVFDDEIVCANCAGSGERYWHSDDCRFDDCVLAAGLYDCLGTMQPCPCRGGNDA